MAGFPGVRSLFGGRGLPQAQEDDHEENNESQNGGKPAAGPTEAQVNALVSTEVSKATKDATATANARWNTVMTSDAGIANPKAAARLLNTTTMSAEDVGATLGDITPPKVEREQRQQDERQQQQNDRNANDRQQLNDRGNNPTTGGAGGTQAQRRGEGDNDRSAETRQRREDRATRRNKNPAAHGGKQANQ